MAVRATVTAVLAAVSDPPERVTVTVWPDTEADPLPLAPVKVTLGDPIVWSLGNATVSFPEAGHAFTVVNPNVYVVSVLVTRLEADVARLVRVPAMIVAAGADSASMPMLALVRVVMLKVPELPAVVGFVTPVTVTVMAVPNAVCAPPERVRVTSRPEAEPLQDPSAPETVHVGDEIA